MLRHTIFEQNKINLKKYGVSDFFFLACYSPGFRGMSGLDTIIQQHYQMAILVQKLYNGVGVLAFMPAKLSSNISTYVLLRKYTRGP